MEPLRCPICKKEVAAEAATFPFCCERCRLIDLGNWLDGKYALTSSDSDPDDDRRN